MRGRREREGSRWVRGIAIGLGLAVALATASEAQEQSAAAPSATAPEQPAATKAEGQPQGGMGEGIKVHGHWTIDIKNPDGSLASHLEFENSLVPGTGNTSLAVALGGIQGVGPWTIVLYDLLGDGPCGTAVLPAPCRPAVSIDPAVALTGVLELKSSTPITATHDSIIAAVATEFRPSVALAGQFGGGEFSRRYLAPADQKAVTTGQIIQVKVLFTFS